jgi:ankyrin repeat protein
MHFSRLFLFSVLSFFIMQSSYLVPAFHNPIAMKGVCTNPADRIIFAAEEGKLDDVIQCLTQLDPTNSQHYIAIHTALISACSKGKVNIVKYLVAQSYIDVNFQNSATNIYALFNAATRTENKEIIELLLNHNANWHLKGIRGKTALELPGGSIIKQWLQECKAIFKAIEDGDCTTLVLLLQIEGLRQIKDDTGNTPLHSAILKNKRKAIKAVLSIAPELVSLKNNDDLTCLELAIKQRDIALIVMLLCSNPKACQAEDILFLLANNKLTLLPLFIKAGQP